MHIDKRETVVNKYILLSQVFFFLMFGILILRSVDFSYDNLFLKLPAVIIFTILLSSVPLLRIINLKASSNKVNMILDFVIIIIYLVVSSFLLFNETENLFKVILLMPAVFTAIKYSIKTAIIAATLSLIALMAISLAYNTVLIDAIVIFGGVNFLLAWLIGNMTETEKEIRTELFKDIAARKKTEEALRESEERYRQLVELSPDGIIIWSEEIITFANKAAGDLYGLNDPALLIGRKISDLIHHSDIEATDKWIRQVLSEEKTKPYLEVKSIRDDSVIFDVELEAIRFSHQGQPAGQVIIRDTTERKRMEEELIKVSKLESVGVLAGGIAHDFNNLLTIIFGNISLAKRCGPGDEKNKIFLTEVEKAAKQAQDLTQQLLTFAKEGTPDKKVVSIAEVLKESATLILSGSNVKGEYSFANDLLPLEVDEGQMKQVVNNLVINATHAMQEGGTIFIKAENILVEQHDLQGIPPLKPGRFVMISIKDEGEGISAENLQKVFDPYFTTKEKGNGLGLATSYAIIKKHNGHIYVESEVGTGTIFTIYLPAVVENKPAKSGEQEIKLGGIGKILVMDDDDAIRAVTINMLEELGYEVDATKEGMETIELYQKAYTSGQTFDVVIIDLTIPGGMGGKKTIEKLLEIDPDVKAIVSSGYANDQVLSNHKEYGFKGFITKPYSIEEVHKVVAEAISSNDQLTQ